MDFDRLFPLLVGGAVYMGFTSFGFVWFFFFEPGFLCETLAVLVLTLWTQAVLRLRDGLPLLLRAEIKSMHLHTRLLFV